MSNYIDLSQVFLARKAEERLPAGASVLVIGGLSTLCWVIIVVVGAAISSIL